MIMRILRYLMQNDVHDAYMKGWSDGVLQHMYDEESCQPISWIHGENWPTRNQYWRGEK